MFGRLTHCSIQLPRSGKRGDVNISTALSLSRGTRHRSLDAAVPDEMQHNRHSVLVRASSMAAASTSVSSLPLARRCKNHVKGH